MPKSPPTGVCCKEKNPASRTSTRTSPPLEEVLEELEAPCPCPPPPPPPLVVAWPCLAAVCPCPAAVCPCPAAEACLCPAAACKAAPPSPQAPPPSSVKTQHKHSACHIVVIFISQEWRHSLHHSFFFFLLTSGNHFESCSWRYAS